MRSNNEAHSLNKSTKEIVSEKIYEGKILSVNGTVIKSNILK